MTFSKRIKELRVSKGLTQSDLAKAIGVGRTTVCEYESGNIVPKQEGLLKIANYFSVSVDYLAGISDTPVTQVQNSLELDSFLKIIRLKLSDESDKPVKFDGKRLSSKQKAVVEQLVEQLSDNIEMILKL